MFGIIPCLYAHVINAYKHNNQTNIYYIIYIYINYALLFPGYFYLKDGGWRLQQPYPLSLLDPPMG